MTFNFPTFDPEDPVDFDALFPLESPSTTSCNCTCTFTKTIFTRVLAMPINTGCTRPSNPPDISDVISKSDLRSFTLKELQVATCNFSDKFLLGEGGFGKVHKALLPDGSIVAIKRLDYNRRQGLREFQAEVEISSRVRHRNLVPPIGFCVSKRPEENILVYPFKDNGDLHSRLRKRQSQPPLDWPTRKRILLGAAWGLSFLHDNRIIHRDIKPSNILLDENLEACIGDYGLAKALDEKEQLSSLEVQNHAVLRFPTEREMATNWSSFEYIMTSRIVGTYGYMAPEYMWHGICSVKNDVYGFGVLICELVTGRTAIDIQRMGNSKNSSFSWMKSCLKENNLDMLIDSDLRGNCSEDDVKKIIQLGLACTLQIPEKRPSMHQVVQVLEGAGLEDIGTDTDYIMEAHVNGFYDCRSPSLIDTTANSVYVERLKFENTATVELCNTSAGRSWTVRCIYKVCNNNQKRCKLTTGWRIFVKDNKLVEGDVCTFKLVKRAPNPMVFHVTICRVSDDSIFDDGVIRRSSLNPTNPSFSIVMQPSYVRNCILNVSRSVFIGQLGLQSSRILKLCTSNGRSWTTKYYCTVRNNKAYCKLGYGWREFVKDNNLEEGDQCVFKLINPTLTSIVFHVTIYKYAAALHNNKHGKRKREDQIICSRPWKKLEPASASNCASKHVFFRRMMSHCNLGSSNLSIPNVAARRMFMLSKETVKKVKLEFGDRTWSVKAFYYPKYGSGKISAGWTSFARDNFLKVGDICSFELVDDSEKLVMKVSIERAKSLH